VDEERAAIHSTTYKVASDVVGLRKKEHRDLFDDNDPEISAMLDGLQEKHFTWINDKIASPSVHCTLLSVRRFKLICTT